MMVNRGLSATVLLAALLTVLLQTNDVHSIVGGHTTLPGEAPYIVSIRSVSGSSHLCAGVLIKTNWVLTTARCTGDLTQADLVVLAGSQRLLTNKKPLPISTIVRHPSYSGTTGAHNLALLQLVAPITVSSRLGTIELNDAAVVTGAVTAFYGWGALRYGTTSYSNELQTLYQRALSTTDCRTRLTSLVEGDICAIIQPGQAACTRDEGGPLVLQGTKKLMGVFSYGTQCSGVVPDVFVDVQSHSAWIAQTAV
ncbi:chymotrypsin-2-like [Anopheles aquasalis]|uniref:chymotrypsin-2-like n=1 Tax=Anopheles aquasalis TaxID=42839 RepID=UPI00215B2768|nr:chymotrypsin-2-like [Anopheles aquasalis]